MWPDVPARVERALASPDVASRRAAAHELAVLSPARAAPLVLRALEDPDLEVRLAAAQAAVRLRIEGAVDAVLPWLGERDARLRLAAANVVKALPTASAVNPVARALGDSDVLVRAAAAEALGAQRTPEAVAPLLGRLDDPSPQVRVQIARALARLGDTRAVVPLVGKVQDSAPEVRQAVARALGELGDARAAQALVLQLRDNVLDVRVEALAALGTLRARDAVDAIAPLATERTANLRQAALVALGRIGTPEAVRALIGALGYADDAGAPLERTAVRDALVLAGDAAVPELRAVLVQGASPSSATSAAWVLGELRARSESPTLIQALRRGTLPAPAAMRALAGAGDRTALPVVLEFVGDPNPLVRSEAIAAASALLDPAEPDGRAVEPLAAALQSSRIDSETRSALARLLGRTGAPRAAPVLSGLLSSREPAVRLAALEALGTLGPAGADDVLLAQLDAKDPKARLRAAVALSEAGGPVARDALLARLESGHEADRAALLTALAGVMSREGTDAAVTQLTAALEVAAGPERDALLVAVGRAKPPRALDVLTRVAASDVDDRRTAACVLPADARTRDPRARELAQTWLADPDAAVAAQAAWALGTLGDASTLPALAAKAQSPTSELAANATAAMGRILARASSGADGKGGPDAAAHLCPLLGSARPYVRANALAGLAHSARRCGDGQAERRLLADDPNDQVRASAARALARKPIGADDRAALERCAATDRSGNVARLCRRSDAPPSRRRAVEVYVVPESGSSPQPRALYALELADGFLRTGVADRRGAIVDPAAPDGELALRRPSALAR